VRLALIGSQLRELYRAMDARYRIEDSSEIITPALIVFRQLLERNVERMIEIAGRPDRLRPHCKTHKISEVVELQLRSGIGKHKCATLAEAEMLARAGAKDIFLAYNLVGPNVKRAVDLLRAYPGVSLSVTADHPGPLAQLGEVARRSGMAIDVLLDIDTGMHRTGAAIGDRAKTLYEGIVETPGVSPGGLHVYDGHNHQRSIVQRRASVHAAWADVISFRDELVASGWTVPRIVAGGSGTFPVYAAIDEPTLELSPGTVVFHDAGYADAFPDLRFDIAALLLTRVVSRPGEDRVTCDLGTKACASDPPEGNRLVFPDLPEAKQVLQNEEHLVLQTPRASQFQPGEELLAIPRHICPTTALHKQVYVVDRGHVVGRWDVVARDRWLTI
jgi:D-serine deaminase-like pyridoxal phosphate-dependent protein